MSYFFHRDDFLSLVPEVGCRPYFTFLVTPGKKKVTRAVAGVRFIL